MLVQSDMARALALFFWTLAAATVAAFLLRPVWMPELISAHGVELDAQLNLTLAVAGAAFFLAQVLIGACLWRMPEAVLQWHESPRLELTWTVVTAIVFVGLGLQGSAIWARSHLTDAPANALVIEVTGQQFAWNVRYPGADGKFGRTRPDMVNDSEGNYIGADDADPAGFDDITAQNIIAIPVNRPVKVLVKSRDVLHSFFVPALRVKQDAVPGMAIPIHFTATKSGEFEVACAELCGMQHFKMRARFLVMSDSEFAAWLKARAGQ